MSYGFFGNIKEDQKSTKGKDYSDLPIFQPNQKEGSSSPQPPYPEADYDLPDEFADRLFEQGVSKTYARVGEGALGVPGNLANLANRLTGEKIPKLNRIAKGLPTTEDIKGFTKKYGGDYLKEGEEGIEKIAGDFLTNVGSYAVPFGPVKYLDKANKLLSGYRFLSPLISPALGEGAKSVTKALGGSEDAQERAGIAAMIVNDVFANRGKGVNGYINKLFQEAVDAVPKGTTSNANAFFQALNKTKNAILRGGKDPTKEKALTQIDNLLSRFSRKGKNYFIDPSEFIEMRKAVNNMIDSLGGFGSDLTHRGRRTAVGHLNDVRKDVIDAGMEYGNKFNPKFSKYWDAANEAYRVNAKSNVVMRFLEKIIPQKQLQKILNATATGAVIHKGVVPTLVSTAKGAVLGAPIAAGARGAYEIGKIAYRSMKSPTLRKYYENLFKHAAEKEGKAVALYSDKVESQLEKEDKKSKELMKKRFNVN